MLCASLSKLITLYFRFTIRSLSTILLLNSFSQKNQSLNYPGIPKDQHRKRIIRDFEKCRFDMFYETGFSYLVIARKLVLLKTGSFHHSLIVY